MTAWELRGRTPWGLSDISKNQKIIRVVQIQRVYLCISVTRAFLHVCGRAFLLVSSSALLFVRSSAFLLVISRALFLVHRGALVLVFCRTLPVLVLSADTVVTNSALLHVHSAANIFHLRPTYLLLHIAAHLLMRITAFVLVRNCSLVLSTTVRAALPLLEKLLGQKPSIHGEQH